MMPWHNTTLGPICMIAQACLSFFPTLAHRAHASQRLGAGPPGLGWPKIVREADQAVQRHGGRPAGQHSIYPNILTVCGITVYFSIYPSILLICINEYITVTPYIQPSSRCSPRPRIPLYHHRLLPRHHHPLPPLVGACKLSAH